MKSMMEFIDQQLEDIQVDVAIDFTVGNGNDTLKLAGHAHTVYGFDIQPVAIATAQSYLEKKGVDLTNIHLYAKNHLDFDQHVTDFDLGMFNLGYLPGGDHAITTIKENTLATLAKATEKLRPGGIVFLAVYVGHDNGRESDAVYAFCEELTTGFNISCYKMVNKIKSPYIIVLERQKK